MIGGILPVGRAVAELDLLERRRVTALAAAAACPAHRWTQIGDDRPFMGPVADARPGASYNPAAHGNITRTVRCRCGAERDEAINGRHLETSGARAATAEIDDEIAAARRAVGIARGRAARAPQVPTRPAWRAGDLTLRVCAVASGGVTILRERWAGERRLESSTFLVDWDTLRAAAVQRDIELATAYAAALADAEALASV